MNSVVRITAAVMCLVVATPVFAEVADKEPTLGRLWAWTLGINAIAALLALIRPKLGLIVLPISALFAFAGYMELTDPYVGPDILRELGQGYVTTSYIVYGIGLIGPVLIVILATKLRRRRG